MIYAHASAAREREAARVHNQLEHERPKIRALTSALGAVYDRPPPSPGDTANPGPAIAALRRQLHLLRGQVSRDRNTTRAGRKARNLTVEALSLFEQSAAKLADAASVRDQRDAVAHMR